VYGFLLLKAFKNWLNTSKWTPFGALRASPPSSTIVTRASVCVWNLLFLFRWWRGDAFYTHTFFTNGQRYAQKPLHRAVFIHSYSYTDRLCTQKLLYRRRFTHRFWQKNVQTKNSTHRCFTQRCFCTAQHLRTDELHAHRRFTYRCFHAEASTQRYLCTEQFLHKEFFLASEKKQTGT